MFCCECFPHAWTFFVTDTPEEKETLAETVSKAQEKLERKRQRKLEKKLAKQQLAESENATEVEEAPAKVKKSKVRW